MPLIPIAALVVGSAVALASPAEAPRHEPPAAAASMHATPRLIAETTALVPGQVTNLGVTFKIEKGWHLYWKGLSDTGMPILIKPGATAATDTWEDQIWPAPTRHEPAEDILDHVYEGQVTIILPVRVSADAKVGDYHKFPFKLDWLVCREACVLESASVTLEMPVAAESRPSDDAPLFAQTRARQAVAAPQGRPAADPITVTWESPEAVQIGFQGAKGLEFYPWDDSSRPIALSTDGRVQGGTIRLRFEPPEKPEPARLHGVLKVEQQDSNVRYYWVNSVFAPGEEAGHRAVSPASK